VTRGSARIGKPERILLATDLSSRCDRALERALQLGREWNAELHVAHVIAEKTEFEITGRSWAAPSLRADDRLDQAELRLRKDIGPGASDVRVKVHVIEGSPGEAICELAKREKCDLIITGVARNESLGRMILGDTVDFLVRRATVPVLVVRNRVHGPYAEVVAATDFSAASAEALRTALGFFPRAKTGLFHAYEIPFAGILTVNDAIRREFREMDEKAMCEFLRAIDLPEDFPRTLERGPPAAALARYLEGHDALVAIGSHGASAISRIVLGSTAGRVLDHTQGDVLVVPPGEQEFA
jgi:nucleotide-binding universal stress UspA family protein